MMGMNHHSFSMWTEVLENKEEKSRSEFFLHFRRNVPNDREEIVIIRSEDREPGAPVPNHSCRVNDDDGACGPSQPGGKSIQGRHLSKGIRQQPLGKVMALAEGGMGFAGVHGDSDYLGLGVQIFRPMVTEAAHLFGANKCLILGIKKKDDDLPSIIAEPPWAFLSVKQLKIKGCLPNMAPLLD